MASKSMDIDFKEYQLSCQLKGHEDDARGICICVNAGIATSSRDRTVRFWTLDGSQKRDYSMSKILLGQTSFLGPLAWIPPNEEFPEGGVISGGKNSVILVWNLATGEKSQMLKGHKLQVTGIALDGLDVVSSSVDCTLRRWSGGQQVEEWEAHKAAIQAVIKLPSGELVTGSSDMTMKLWKGKSCVHTFQGHTDTVRGVAIMPKVGILSASHDGTIRLWAISGELLMEMAGHSSKVYSVDAHASGLIVSGSEDCSAKIWEDGVCVQSIDHPGRVWDAKFLESRDIVTACSDGIVRIWTIDHEKTAEAVELDSFASQISQYKLSRKKVGGLKLKDLPSLDALKTPAPLARTVFLRCGNKTFEVDMAIGTKSEILRLAMEIHEEKEEDEPIVVKDIKPEILDMVITYCERHVQADEGENLEQFDADFVQVDRSVLYHLLKAAMRLEIRFLIDLVSKTIAKSVSKMKSVSEFRKAFDIEEESESKPERSLFEVYPWAN